MQSHTQPSSSDTPAILTRDLTRRFGSFLAVDRLDLHVPRGAFYGFLGPNGAGKSTTIKMLTGLLSPSEGQIEVFGLNLAQSPLEIKRRIGVVPENLALFERLTGPEMLHFAGRMHGLSRDEVARRAHELLHLMELDDLGGTLIVEYSHGMKKKLALAAALIHSPQLLFLDEPFEGVDAVASRTLRTLLQATTARGMTIFLTSHVLEIVEKLCTHVAILQKGRIQVAGELDQLKQASESLESLFLSVVGERTEAPQQLDWLLPPGSDGASNT